MSVVCSDENFGGPAAGSGTGRWQYDGRRAGVATLWGRSGQCVQYTADLHYLLVYSCLGGRSYFSKTMYSACNKRADHHRGQNRIGCAGRVLTACCGIVRLGHVRRLGVRPSPSAYFAS